MPADALVGPRGCRQTGRHCEATASLREPLLCFARKKGRCGIDSGHPHRRLLQVETLTVSLTDLWTNLFKPAFDICYNTVMLYQTLGMSGVSYTSGYMLVAFGLMRFIVPNFRALTRKQFDLESRFRAVHNRLVDHTESIAFFGGDDVEKRIVDERFEVPPLGTADAPDSQHSCRVRTTTRRCLCSHCVRFCSNCTRTSS